MADENAEFAVSHEGFPKCGRMLKLYGKLNCKTCQDFSAIIFRIRTEVIMVTPSIATVVKMMESLPEETQSQVVEHLREWLLDMEDEAVWDESFARTQKGLYEAAQDVRKQTAEGKSEPMDFNRL